MPYDAFISYSHAADGKLAPALQSALHRFAKPWYRLRAVQVFRDKTSLSVSPALWPAIEVALSDSEYFILLASPEAAASHWVQQEVDYWIDNRSTDKLLIILTDGELSWNDKAGDFDWNLTTALPPNLRSSFRQEPLYLDLRWARTQEHLSLTNPKFRESVAEVAAPLRGQAKDDLVGEDVRQHRRTKQVTWSAILTLATLAVVASWQAYVATQQRNIAERRTRVVTSQLIADRAQGVLEEYPVRGLILAAEALNVTLRADENEPHVPAAEAVLREALANVDGRGLGWYEHGAAGTELSPDGQWLVTNGKGNTVLLWDLSAAEPTLSPIVLRVQEKNINDVAVSPNSDWLATCSGDRTVRLWNLRASDPTANPRILQSQEHKMEKVTFSPDGRWLITSSYNAPVLVWDLTSDAPSEGVRVIPGHGRYGIEIDISGDSRWLVLSNDNLATVWDLTNPDRPVIKLEESVGDIYLEISPSGRWVATRSDANVVRLWDLSLDEPEANPIELEGHLERPTSALFSADSDRLVTLSKDITKIWNLRAGDPAASSVVLADEADPLVSFSISPDGRKLTGHTTENAILTWDLHNLAEAPKRRHSPARDFEYPWFSANGEWLLATAGDEVGLWHSDHFVSSVFPGDRATLSPDHRWLVTVNPDNTLRVFDLTARHPDRDSRVLRGHEDTLYRLLISADSRWLITTGNDWTVRLWRLDGNDAPASPSMLRGHESNIETIAVSPDSKWLLTASDEPFAQLWRIDSSYPGDSITLRNHRGGIESAAFSADSRWLVTGGRDKTARLWDLRGGDAAAESVDLTGHESRIPAVAFSPDGKWLATASDNNYAGARVTPTVRLWDLTSSNIAESAVVLGKHRWRIYALEFSHDSRWLITRSEEKNARLWNLESPDPGASPVLVPQQKETIRSVVISPDSRWLVARNDDQSALLWNLETFSTNAQPIELQSYEPPPEEPPEAGPRYVTFMRGHDGVISTVAFTPDGRWLVTRGHQNTASLWNLTSNDPAKNRLVLEGHTKNISSVAISPDGRWLATGSADRTAALWRLDARDQDARPVFLHGHEAPVFDVTISPDSRWLLTRSDDKTARLWDLTAEDPAKSAIVIHGDDEPIRFAAFSPDGRWLLIGDKRATALQLWPLRLEEVLQRARRAAGRNLTINEWSLFLSNQPYQKTFPDFPWPSGPGSGSSGR